MVNRLEFTFATFLPGWVRDRRDLVSEIKSIFVPLAGQLMVSMDPTDLKGWLAVGHAHTIVKYGIVSTLLLSIVDTLETLPEEVSLIWFAEWNAGKVLYLLSRYNVLWSMGLVLFHSTSRSVSQDTCWPSFVAGTAFVAASVVVAEAILYLRVYALAGPRRNVALVLCTFFLAVHTAVFWFLAQFLRKLEFPDEASPLPEIIGCFPSKAPPWNLSTAFSLIMLSELAILIATLWIITTKYRESSSRLVTTLYEDGIIYYVLITVVSVGNIICALVAPRGYINLLATTQQVLHSILSSRMVLHIRELDRKASFSSVDIPLSAIEHATLRLSTERSRNAER